MELCLDVVESEYSYYNELCSMDKLYDLSHLCVSGEVSMLSRMFLYYVSSLVTACCG